MQFYGSFLAAVLEKAFTSVIKSEVQTQYQMEGVVCRNGGYICSQSRAGVASAAKAAACTW